MSAGVVLSVGDNKQDFLLQLSLFHLLGRGHDRIVKGRIAIRAQSRKTGARGLRSILEEIMLDVMYDLPSLQGVKKCVVNKETLEAAMSLSEGDLRKAITLLQGSSRLVAKVRCGFFFRFACLA